jgi:nitrogenase iron protein NifH
VTHSLPLAPDVLEGPRTRIAVYGKGGIGKSTVCSHLSVIYAEEGDKVLLVGCDPKHDSTLRVANGAVTTVMGQLARNPNGIRPSAFVTEGRFGIDLIECGGPEPGAGCGGRGVAKMFDMFRTVRLLDNGPWSAVVFDILGDVVCGGFAAPLRKGFAEKAFIVTSEEVMSLYAANNVAKAIKSYGDNGVALGGIIANLREDSGRGLLENFARALGTTLVGTIPRDPLILEAEAHMKTVVEYRPDAPISAIYRDLAARVKAIDPATLKIPTPMEESEFQAFIVENMRRS